MNTFPIKMKNKAKRAFTLIEIMVATVIMVVLVGLVIQITSEVLKVWSRSSGKLAANAEARIAMDMITQDLETAVFRNNEQQWLRVESPLPTGATDKVKAEEQTVALKLFSPALDRPAGPGDICAIGYRLKHQLSYEGATEPVYALYRMIVAPDVTFDNYLGSGVLDTSPQRTLDGETSGDSEDWSDGAIQDTSNYLVSNIVEFKVFIYLDDGTSPSKPVNVKTGTFELEGHYAYGGKFDGGSDGVTTPLLYADIILTVVSDQGLEMLEVIDKISETVAEVVALHGDTFTRRVNFMAHPL